MIEFRNATWGYVRGQAVLDRVTAIIEGPGLFWLTGANGTGKSTLLEGLSGHLRPWEGTVLVNGEPPRQGRFRTVTLGRTDASFLDGVTMRDHCHLFAGDDALAHHRLAAAVSQLDLDRYLDEPDTALSSGTRKKFWLSLLLARSTPVLAVDEPFNAVDQRSRTWISAQLVARAAEQLVLVVTHDLPGNWSTDGAASRIGPLELHRVRTSEIAEVQV